MSDISKEVTAVNIKIHDWLFHQNFYQPLFFAIALHIYKLIYIVIELSSSPTSMS